MNPSLAKNSRAVPIRDAVSGVLFDMDGVLVSSTLGDERCWTRWAARHGLTKTFNLKERMVVAR